MNPRVLSAWEVSRSAGPFVGVSVPCTAAGVLRERGEWQLGDAAPFDDETWVFRCRFAGGDENRLEFDGLTPGAVVTLNGVEIGRCDSMFLGLRLPVTLAAENHLEIRFTPLAHTPRKPRARWRTRLLDQQWRWVRTTAIGRMPAFSPLFGTIGPWRAVRVVRREVEQVTVGVQLDGHDGIVTWSGTPIGTARGTLRLDDQHAELRGDQWHATLRLRNADRWWPHTHGAQPRYRLALDSGAWHDDVAFRTIERTDPFGLRINGVDVFCRGACWIPPDPVGLRDHVAPALELARASHLNMLRVTANTLYESDAFYAECDRLGILVWQDFMFASFDYPFADDAFAALAKAEADEFLRRTQTRACVAVLCGNSEVEMQAMLVGKPVETPEFFADALPKLCATRRPDVPYVAGTPGGSVPMVSPQEGWSHYYGVGVFLRPLIDARLSKVRFATECLGFAQPPARATQAEWAAIPWAERITNGDTGVGNFDETHRYYVKQMYGLDPDVLERDDPALWQALFEILPGEVMAATYAEWRVTGQCRGGLIWNWQDMWPSPGLGLRDAAGRPKAAMHYLRRALAPRAVFLADEGLNGLFAHLLNEPEESAHADLVIELFADGVCTERHVLPQSVAARGMTSVAIDLVLGRFADVQRAWRLGSMACELVVARWGDAAPAFFFPGGWPVPAATRVGLEAVRAGARLRIRTCDFAHTVVIDGADASDNYFHLAPNETREVQVGTAPIVVSALGATDRVTLP